MFVDEFLARVVDLAETFGQKIAHQRRVAIFPKPAPPASAM
jgi:hypothetical protein